MTLFIDEPELYALLGLDKVNGPGTVRSLERFGMPKIEPPFTKRYRPAVVQWLNNFHKVRTADGRMPGIDGEERNDERPKARKTRRLDDPRPGVAPAADRRLDHVMAGMVDRDSAGIRTQDRKVVARIGPDGATRHPDAG